MQPATVTAENPRRGGWVKGQSGNPLGRAKGGLHVRDLCRQFTEEAVRALRAIMNDTDEKAAPRVAAAQVLLDRGWGKAETTITVRDESNLIELDDHELRAIIERSVDAEDAEIVPPAVPQLADARTSAIESDSWE